MSYKPKDMLGNTLEEGQLIFVKMGMDWCIGSVIKLNMGGIKTPDGKETPGECVIGIQPLRWAFAPNKPVNFPCVRLVNPQANQILEDIIGGSPAPGESKGPHIV